MRPCAYSMESVVANLDADSLEQVSTEQRQKLTETQTTSSQAASSFYVCLWFLQAASINALG